MTSPSACAATRSCSRALTRLERLRDAPSRLMLAATGGSSTPRPAPRRTAEIFAPPRRLDRYSPGRRRDGSASRLQVLRRSHPDARPPPSGGGARGRLRVRRRGCCSSGNARVGRPDRPKCRARCSARRRGAPSSLTRGRAHLGGVNEEWAGGEPGRLRRHSNRLESRAVSEGLVDPTGASQFDAPAPSTSSRPCPVEQRILRRLGARVGRHSLRLRPTPRLARQASLAPR